MDRSPSQGGRTATVPDEGAAQQEPEAGTRADTGSGGAVSDGAVSRGAASNGPGSGGPQPEREEVPAPQPEPTGVPAPGPADDRTGAAEPAAAAGASPNDPVPEDPTPEDANPEDAIPEGVATSREELPADFWDSPPAEPQRTARRAAPAPTPRAETRPAPRGRGARRDAPQHDRSGNDRSGNDPSRNDAPRSGRRAEGRSGTEPTPALERALLGSESDRAVAGDDGEGSDDALVDTLQALQELFPGEVLAVTPRESASEADVPTLQADPGEAESGDDGDTAEATAPERDPGASGT